MEDVAEPARLDEALHLAHERIVEEGLVDEEHPCATARGLDQLAPVVRGERERLLDPDVLAGLERREHHRVVPARRCGEDDRVDVVAAEELRVVGRASGAGMIGREGREACRIEVAERRHARRLQLAEGAEEVLPPVPEADDADVDARRAHTTRRTRKTSSRCARSRRLRQWTTADPAAAESAGPSLM